MVITFGLRMGRTITWDDVTYIQTGDAGMSTWHTKDKMWRFVYWSDVESLDIELTPDTEIA